MDIADFKRLYAYDDWANREVLASLARIAAPPEKSVRWLPHIVGTQYEWMARLKNEKSPLAVWPELTLTDVAPRLDELAVLWRDYLDSLEADSLAGSIAYRNMQGEPFTSARRDILQHVATHSVHHRGQIAADVRASGHTPARTDFIIAVRSGALPG